MNPDYIALVRSGPDGPLPELPARVAEGAVAAGAPLVFLHGEGVQWGGVRPADWTSVGRSPGRVCVCRTSWRRRFGERPPPRPFRTATLTVLLEHLAAVDRIDSFAPGTGLCSMPSAAGRALLFEIDRPPLDDRDALETLEVVLAAAALALPAGVLVTAAGAGHLDGESGRRWRQITDLGLLPVHAGAGDGARAEADRLVLL